MMMADNSDEIHQLQRVATIRDGDDDDDDDDNVTTVSAVM